MLVRKATAWCTDNNGFHGTLGHSVFVFKGGIGLGGMEWMKGYLVESLQDYPAVLFNLAFAVLLS